MKNNTRAITLVGANKIFSVVEVEIEAISTGGYSATGRVSCSARTLTELCQQIALSL